MMISNLLVNCYGWNGMGTEALKLYRQLPQDLISEVTNVCVVNACSHAGLVAEARVTFHKIQNKTSSLYGAMASSIDCSIEFEFCHYLINLDRLPESCIFFC